MDSKLGTHHELMDFQTMQSMDWLFKKERIYLLAQFWQQRATLAEKEVSSLKEQLSSHHPLNHHDKMAGSPTSQDDVNRSGAEELSAKDKEICVLTEKIHELEARLNEQRETIARREEELEHKTQQICRLESRQRDYDDLKRQISSSLRTPEPHQGIEPLVQKSLESILDKSKCESNSTNKRPTCSTPTDLSDKCRGTNSESESDREDRDRSSTRTQRSGTRSPADPPTPKSPTPTPTLTPTPTPTPTHTPTPAPATPGPERERERELAKDALASALVAVTTATTTTPTPTPASEMYYNTHLNNNTLAANNNNFINGLCGLNNNLDLITKGPFRFDDHRSPYDPSGIVRFGESLIPKGDPMEARLQEMLRYNMDKYSSQNLDTLHIARRVRELLSIHNVGQRLFAKYVLGLSQGTVSELLSKPKPWDKLTEKGRDSYRKMHAWACDENAVLLLKSLIPKKGKDGGITGVFGRGEADMTEERIAHILNEASQMMKPGLGMAADQDSRHSDDSRSPSHGQCPSPQGRRMKKYENDDISQEQVVRIYQEELTKLMGRRLDENMRGDQPFPGILFPPFFGGATNPDDIRLAMEAYHRELSKLNAGQVPSVPPPNLSNLIAMQQQAAVVLNQSNPNGFVQDLSLPKMERKQSSLDSEKQRLLNGDIEDKKEQMMPNAPPGMPESVAEALKHAGSAFSLVHPKPEPVTRSHTPAGSSTSSPLGNSILPPEDFSPGAAVSPLQRMASITNALISQPPTPHHHSPAQRPLKAVLPPITQQQFDQFNNLNTEDIVRKVKEQLSQFSISQRLFGESVLGLSQGSVSDLLARPKPWHMLTQKGREPFIRMKMFLEDENAVHKLVASQYKIAPEKLMRTGGYGGATPMGQAIGKPLPPTNCAKIPTSQALVVSEQHKIERELPSDHRPDRDRLTPHHFVPDLRDLRTSVPTPLSALPPPLYSSHAQQEQIKKCHSAIQQQCNALQQQHMNSALRNLSQHVTPSVYEMAALTQDLDTQTITTKIKEALLANNIGQKIFGEAVLGLSQGSVSELLSKPKPWHMLSIKGREPFIRMQLWLADAHNIDRLQAIKTERRELNKRRRSLGGHQDNSSDTSSNDTSEFYHSGACSPPSAKKQRVLFSEEQKEALKLAYTLDPYPSLSTIEFLASELQLTSRTISNWFHNHRMRLKQQSPQSELNQNRENQTGSSSGFDPVQFRILLSQRLGLSNIPIPFPTHYFPPNPELAALMQRSMLPLNEQVSGLDLSIKHEHDHDRSDDEESRYSEHSDAESEAELPQDRLPEARSSSRRKPVAPQWVNPDWQEESEVIINGVCVMQTDYNEHRDSETVRVEPTPVKEEDGVEPQETADEEEASNQDPEDDKSPSPSDLLSETNNLKSETECTKESNKEVVIKREDDNYNGSEF
nr:PREDICTED: homeobox protein cut isoform X2 [Bemisia tabaci]